MYRIRIHFAWVSCRGDPNSRSCSFPISSREIPLAPYAFHAFTRSLFETTEVGNTKTVLAHVRSGWVFQAVRRC